MQCCYNCINCVLDTQALRDGILMDSCKEFEFYVAHPLFSGWKCPRHQMRFQQDKMSLWGKIKEKLLNR